MTPSEKTPRSDSNPAPVKSTDTLKFICPEMGYKLWYLNDEGRYTYDYHIPPDIIRPYCDKVAEAIDQEYFYQMKHPNVIRATPGVEVIDSKLHGIFNISLNAVLTKDSAEELKNELTDLTNKWSYDLESLEITTDGGELRVRFYGSPDPILTETAFNNKRYINQNKHMTSTAKFNIDESGDYITMTYFSPNSSTGGHLVHNYLYLDVLKKIFNECENEEQFWCCLDERANQYLTDIDTPEFAEEARCFVEDTCDFSGQSRETMDAIQEWVNRQYAEIDRLQGMNMT